MENETTQNTINIRQAKDKQSLLDNFKQMPIIESACRKSNISRTSFYRWKREDKEFAKAVEEAMQEGIDLINDLSENQVISMIRDGHFQAAQLWLKTYHKRYKERLEISATINPQEELSDEEAAVVREAMRLATIPELDLKMSEEQEQKKNDENDNSDEKKDEIKEPETPEQKLEPESELKYIKSESELTYPITKPTILRKINCEIIFLPRGEKLVKFDNGGNVYRPPSSGEPLVVKNEDGSFSIKLILKENNLDNQNNDNDFQQSWQTIAI
jgi:hypothetical protein